MAGFFAERQIGRRPRPRAVRATDKRDEAQQQGRGTRDNFGSTVMAWSPASTAPAAARSVDFDQFLPALSNVSFTGSARSM